VAREAIRLVVAELNKFRECGITEGELRTAQEHLKGHTLLAAESPDSRMTRLAKCEIYFNRFIPLEEILSSIDRVSADDVQRLAQEIFDRRYLSLAALGPVTGRDITPDLLDA
jgi:predicted Zn-dependent peptidase